MSITDADIAEAYLEGLIFSHREVSGASYWKAMGDEKENLGYYAGYYDDTTRARVERLFRCAHPIFGSIAACGSPDPVWAFKQGKKAGMAMRRAHGRRV